jgi:adenosylcobinamide-GDP ribazoletransferase
MNAAAPVTDRAIAMNILDDLRICLIFFTRLPLRWRGELPRERITAAFRAAPLSGLVIGFIAWAGYAAGSFIGLDPYAAGFLAVGAHLLATGAFHEDGWADTFDGLGGGTDRASKLEIMRDSRIGTYGACALVVALVLKALLIAEISAYLDTLVALMAAAVLAKTAVVVVMRATPPAAEDGQSAAAGRPAAGDVAFALGAGALLTLVLAAVSGPIKALVVAPAAVLAAAAAAAAVATTARRQLGGQTGDVLGACAVAAELAALAAFAALL